MGASYVLASVIRTLLLLLGLLGLAAGLLALAATEGDNPVAIFYAVGELIGAFLVLGLGAMVHLLIAIANSAERQVKLLERSVMQRHVPKTATQHGTQFSAAEAEAKDVESNVRLHGEKSRSGQAKPARPRKSVSQPLR